MQYEEKINDILITLAGAKRMEEENTPVPATFWKQKYEQDVPFLLKELGNTRARGRVLNTRVQELQTRASYAAAILSGEKEPIDKPK